MITRNKLGKRLREERHELALVGVDCYGAEIFGDGGFKERVPKSVKEALEGPEKELWQAAIREELEAMEEAEVWGEPVRIEPWVKVTPLRFIFTKKLGAGGVVERYKARLIFMNRDDEGDQEEDVYAPVVDKASLRVFLAIVAKKGWYLQQSDIKTAFLNAENNGEDYVKLPPCVVQGGESPVRKLQKALYGLKRAPKAWNSTFTEWALGKGFRQADAEPCIFVHQEERVMLAVYVDDLLIAAEDMVSLTRFQDLLKEKFKTRDMGVPTYFLGMNVEFDERMRWVHLTQTTYVDALLEKYNEYLKSPRTLPIVSGVVLSKEQSVAKPSIKPYASLVGALLFLSVCTRPDISYAVGVLAKFLSCPAEQHWEVAVGVLAYVGATRHKGILLGDVQLGARKGIVGYADADWANDVDDRKSISGGAVFYEGSLVSWFSRKQHMICTSTAEAEIHAIMELIGAVRSTKLLLQELLGEFFSENVGVPVIYSDNQPGLDAIKAKRARTKHYDIKVKFIAQGVQNGDFELRKIATSVNVADVFTKALRTARFRALTSSFMKQLKNDWV
jgi:hypothetical protein